MNNRELVKIVAKVVVGMGVSSIVGNVIRCNTPETVKGLKNLTIGVGAFVLSNMAVEHAGAYTDKKIDVIADQIGMPRDPIPVVKLQVVEEKA